MKILLFHAVIFLGYISSICGQSLPEIRDILRQDEGHVIITKLMKESPEVRRKELLAMIVDLVKAHLAKSATSNNKIQFYNAVILLIDAGDEQAILDAFKDSIDNVGLGEVVEVVDALATCRGKEQTDIIEQLARDRLPILGDTLISSEIEEERYARKDLLGSFVRILIGLASSANPSGMARAKKIRDEFAVLYPSDNGKRVLAAIDADLAKIVPRQSASKDAPYTAREPRPLGGKSSPTPNALEAGPVTPSDISISRTTCAVAVMLIAVVVGMLCFFLKRR
jgi:hypothetical protein